MKNTENSPGQSRIRGKKETVRKILEERDFDSLRKWSQKERNPLRILTSLLFDEERVIVWRSIEAIGKAAPKIAEQDVVKIKRQIQRYLWMMNDESGALCWDAPQAIAEILTQIGPFLEEFAIILPSFLIEEPFEAGTRWGMTRLIENRKLPDNVIAHYKSFGPTIIESLGNPDPQIRGNAVLLLKALNMNIPEERKNELRGDKKRFDSYDFDSKELKRVGISSLIE